MAESLDISSLLTIEDGLPYPQWSVIGEWIEQHVPSEKRFAVWNDAVDQWLSALAEALDGVYCLAESPHFLMMAPEQGHDVKSLLAFAEECRAGLLKTLPGVAEFAQPGKLPILLLHGREVYYHYLSAYCPEGEFGGSMGMQVREGLNHIVLQWCAYHDLEKTLAHELTHAAVAHLSMPLWIEEGLTQMFERGVGSTQTPLIDHERGKKQHRFWRNHGLGQFWSGDGFHRNTPAQRFSYELAEVLMAVLVEEHRPRWLGFSRDRQKRLFEFLRNAKSEDAGEAAAREHLGYGLAEIASKFLGEGDWEAKLEAEKVDEPEG